VDATRHCFHRNHQASCSLSYHHRPLPLISAMAGAACEDDTASVSESSVASVSTTVGKGAGSSHDHQSDWVRWLACSSSPDRHVYTSSGPSIQNSSRNCSARTRGRKSSYNPVLSPFRCVTARSDLSRRSACYRCRYHIHRFSVRGCARAAWVCAFSCCACRSVRITTERRRLAERRCSGDLCDVPHGVHAGAGADGA
jgi:hypothetical protein